MRAIVIGGGIGGLSAALALQRIGVEASVFERAPEMKEVGAGLSLWSNAINALEQLGLTEEIISLGSIVRQGRALTDRGRLLSQTDLTQINSGIPCVMVHRADLQRTLLTAVGAENVTTSACCSKVEQAGDKVHAFFEDGRAASADFLIGADGIHSVVRQELFGAAEPRYSGFTCWRGIADFTPTELPQDASELILGKGFKMGVFHCGANRTYWFLATGAPAGGKDGKEGPQHYLLERFGGPSDSLLNSTLTNTLKDRIMRNDLIDRPPAWPWGNGRITLLGDAIHPTTPNLGQGACQAIEDSVFLAESLIQEDNLEQALRLYESRRRDRTAWVTNQSWQSGKMLAGMTNPFLLRMRNIFMRSFLGKRMVHRQFSRLLNYQIPTLPNLA